MVAELVDHQVAPELRHLALTDGAFWARGKSITGDGGNDQIKAIRSEWFDGLEKFTNRAGPAVGEEKGGIVVSLASDVMKGDLGLSNSCFELGVAIERSLGAASVVVVH